MIITLKQKLVAFCLLILSCPWTMAAENYNFLCTFDKAERKVEVIYLQQDSAIPCEVRYTKGSSTKLLWSATQESGYCESKAEAFVDKQAGWGWSCNRGSDMASSANAEVEAVTDTTAAPDAAAPTDSSTGSDPGTETTQESSAAPDTGEQDPPQ